MKQKIKVAFLHKKDHNYLTGSYFSPQSYRFYIKGLMNNERVAVSRITDIDRFKLKSADVVLIMGLKKNRDIEPYFINAISRINKPKIACSYDCHLFGRDMQKNAYEMGVNNFFYHHNANWFYKHAPKEFKYRQIFMCLDEGLYKKVLPWEHRQKDKILLTGSLYNPEYYSLRIDCAKLPCVWYNDCRDQFSADKYQFLLQGWRAHIAACDVVTVNKYLESMASGTLTFCQANMTNCYENLRLVNNHNSVLIDNSNYKKVFEDYLNDIDNPKWQEIAEEGRRHVLKHYNLKTQVNKFIDYIEELI